MFAQIYSNRTAVMPFGRLLMVCLKRVSSLLIGWCCCSCFLLLNLRKARYRYQLRNKLCSAPSSFLPHFNIITADI